MSDFYATSPARYSFMWDLYKDKFAKGEISEDTYSQMSNIWNNARIQDSVPSSDMPNLENELRSSKEISDKCKSSKVYSQNLYAALCNNEFKKGDKVWDCSWRYSGGIVANLREEGDYINWYCSGIGTQTPDYVGESVVTDEVRKDIESFGWTIIEHGNELL
jgi:hypothetical protein